MAKEVRNRVLLYRLQNYAKNHDIYDVDDAVKYLRLNFSEYKRNKFDSLRKYILPTLIAMQNDGNDSFKTPPSKRRKKKNNSLEDELLLRKEHEYLNKRRPIDDSEEEEDSEESTSGHFQFEEEEDPQPKFDLMKQILRSNYSKSSRSAAADAVPAKLESKVEVGVVRSGSVEKNIEVEITGTKRKIEMNGTPDGNIVDTVIQGKSESKSEVNFRGKRIGLNPTFKDFGGMQEILNALQKDVIFPMYHPQLANWVCATGILLHGPPGCGKTTLAHAIANETGFPFYKISATEVVSGVSGASEQNIRDLFSKACQTAPSIVFIDEIDVIASKRENLQREMERRIVTLL